MSTENSVVLHPRTVLEDKSSNPFNVENGQAEGAATCLFLMTHPFFFLAEVRSVCIFGLEGVGKVHFVVGYPHAFGFAVRRHVGRIRISGLPYRVRTFRPGRSDIFHIGSVHTFHPSRVYIPGFAHSVRIFALGCVDVGIFCVAGLDGRAGSGSLSRLLVGNTRILDALVRQVGSAGIFGLEVVGEVHVVVG
ncbi:unnamed protein product [Haemonchus placei]|uniref:Uncharacterized protein n=1 Tax=Haemonchus placei TaxID=6290 RepID=A0A0N4W3X5_HAEPC|nr:unnamed protein product [Haemonchus placei]